MSKEPHKKPPPPPAGINPGSAVIGFVLCFLAGGGLMWGYMNGEAKKKGDTTATADPSKGNAYGSGAKWSDEDSPVPLSSSDPMWGERTAPVTIVVFSDFECPFCTKVETTLEQVKKQYGPSKVRILWKDFPLNFHPNAKPASEAAHGVFELAGAEAFWKFHDKAFQNQKALTRPNFEAWAQEVGVKDMAAFKAGLDSKKWGPKVDANMNAGKKAGVSGTPASFVNGVLVSGAVPFENFKTTIDAELKKAEAKLAAGTPKDRIYVEMSKENKKNAPAKEDDEEKQDTSTYKVPVAGSPIKGNPNADVTLVIFSDFECPFCTKVETTITAVEEKYKDKLRVVWKNQPLPFHPRAEPAAALALEARAQKGDKGFWDAHKRIFAAFEKARESRNKDMDDATLLAVAESKKLDKGKLTAAIKAARDGKPKLEEEALAKAAEDQKLDAGLVKRSFQEAKQKMATLDDEGLWKIAADMGLDVAKVKSAVLDEKYAKNIEADQQLAEGLKANGTPHMFINGRRLSGAVPQAEFEKIIDDELKKADAARKRGVKPEQMYDELTKDGKVPPPPPAEPEPDKKTVALPANPPFKGAANAKLVIQIFSDFECPFCSRVNDTVRKIAKVYDGKVKIVWRDLPLPMHPNAPLAAQAAREAFKQKGPDGFWKFHDKLFDHQKELKREHLEKYAEELGLDLKAFKAALDAGTHKDAVDADAKAAGEAKIGGTPAFIVGNYFVSGAQPYKKFKKIIDRALAEVK